MEGLPKQLKNKAMAINNNGAVDDVKKLLADIQDTERSYNACVNRRMLLYEELKELDTKGNKFRKSFIHNDLTSYANDVVSI